MVLWCDVLHNWENGITLIYPKRVKGKFMWNTSVLKNHGNVPYKQRFKTNYHLPQEQNYKDFQKYIKTSQNKHVTSFPNLTKDTILVVPMPVRGKNYATLRDFIDNATKIQQQEFWKEVAKIAKRRMNEKGKVWISVHGLGVPYTHVRISNRPKYYFSDALKKE